MTNFTEKEKYYWELSEIYISKYSELLKPALATGLCMGIVIEMESDLIGFLKKNPTKENDDKVKNQKNRIEILSKSIDYFDNIANKNLLINSILKRMYAEIDTLNNKVIDLENQLKNANEYIGNLTE